MNSKFKSIAQNNKNLHTIRLFRILLYCWFLIYYNTLAFNVDFFWGKNSFIPKSTIELFFGNSIFNLFNYPLIENNPLVLIIALDVLLMVSFFKLKNRILPILIYFVTLSLDARSYYILDGGNNLISLFSVFNMFFSLDKDKETPISLLNSTLSNLSLLMAKIQVCIVYFIAGHSKLAGDLWSNGTALYYTLSVSEVSLNSVRDIVKIIHPIFIVLPAYFLLAFQLSFPWLIWFKSTRKFMIFAGSVIHLGISFIMGLTFFGYVLCISYCLFYDEADVKLFESRMKAFYSKLKILFHLYPQKFDDPISTNEIL